MPASASPSDTLEVPRPPTVIFHSFKAPSREMGLDDIAADALFVHRAEPHKSDLVVIY